MIPFVDLKAQYLSIQEEIDTAVLKVLASTQFVLGDEVALLEEEFSSYCSTEFGIAVNTGTSALHVALLAAGVGPGDEVITVSHTFIATVAAISYTGATPVFVDIDPVSYTIDTTKIEEVVTEHTKAIVPVHLYGQATDMDPILDIARRFGLLVIEDAAQAHGAEYKGKRVGSLGDIGCFSFYPGKNLGAYGEGGMAVTNNPKYAKTMRMLRDWGQESRYHHVLKGYNYRMDGIQGAILRVKLGYLDNWIKARQSVAANYDRLLKDTNLKTPVVMPYSNHVYHVYTVRSPERDRLQQKLTELDVQTGIHYPIPVHLQPAYADLGYQSGDFPNAEAAARELLSLPIFPELSYAAIKDVSAIIHNLLVAEKLR